MPAIGTHRAEAVLERAEEAFALTPLLSIQLRRGKKVGPSKRAQVSRESRGVIQVTALGERFEERGTPAETGAAEPLGPLSSCGDDRLFRLMYLGNNLVPGIALQPALVVERVIADFVPPSRNHS